MDNVLQSASNLVRDNLHASEQMPRPVQTPLGQTSFGQTPFGARSLETFVDLGLSDNQIARYFRITETKVISLRRYYGLQ